MNDAKGKADKDNEKYRHTPPTPSILERWGWHLSRHWKEANRVDAFGMTAWEHYFLPTIAMLYALYALYHTVSDRM